jgi:hypothetical protein
MVTVVITINMLIASGCLYVAWQVWKLRIALSRAADGLIAAERATAQVLSGAPQGIGRRDRRLSVAAAVSTVGNQAPAGTADFEIARAGTTGVAMVWPQVAQPVAQTII